MRTNWHLWSGIYRPARGTSGMGTLWEAHYGTTIPTVVVDMTLDSWALPFALHLGGPLLGKPGFHFRIGPVNIGWSKL